MTWAQRLKRVFGIDVQTCEACGGGVKIIAAVEDPEVMKKILRNRGRTTFPNWGIRPARCFGETWYVPCFSFHLSAQTVADVYRARWQVELFFKAIEQNLKIKAFLGISLNAVKTQIWIALCVYLLLAYARFVSQSRASFQTLLRRLQVSHFMRRPLADLLQDRPPEKSGTYHVFQLGNWASTLFRENVGKTCCVP